MSTSDERREEAHEDARRSAHCLGCLLHLPHDRCDYEPDEDGR